MSTVAPIWRHPTVRAVMAPAKKKAAKVTKKPPTFYSWVDQHDLANDGANGTVSLETRGEAIRLAAENADFGADVWLYELRPVARLRRAEHPIAEEAL